MSNFKKFQDLHRSEGLFVLPNAWDAKSAMLFQEKGYAAVGTSSAAVAGSLGYPDGEGMPFEDYLFVVRRITGSVQIPVTVDMEMGYAKTDEKILENVLKLMDLGVVGINIEDSSIANSKRTLNDAKAFAGTVEYLKNSLASKNAALFINIRMDALSTNRRHRFLHRRTTPGFLRFPTVFVAAIKGKPQMIG